MPKREPRCRLTRDGSGVFHSSFLPAPDPAHQLYDQGDDEEEHEHVAEHHEQHASADDRGHDRADDTQEHRDEQQRQSDHSDRLPFFGFIRSDDARRGLFRERGQTGRGGKGNGLPHQ